MSLLRSPRLWPLLVTQGLGAVNDNLFKTAMAVLLLAEVGGRGPALVILAGGVFIAPYILLSATAGQIADRFDKARVIRLVKLAEVALMLLAAAALWLHSPALQFAVLFGLGVQATFFSPLKYGILPDHLREHELVAGNGLVEAGTFLGILAGIIAGGALVELPDGPLIVGGIGVAAAVGGVASALKVLPAPSNAPEFRIGWNWYAETVALLRTARANRPVWLSLLGLSWFWVVGATVVAELPILVKDVIGGNADVRTLMLAFFSVGVGAGSIGCARLLKGEVTAWPVPFAAAGLALFLADFSLALGHARGLGTVTAVLHSFAGWRMLADLVLLAACGGIYSVPLYALLQDRSAPGERARMVAANNVVNAVAIAAGAAVTAVLAMAGMGPAAVLGAFALATLLVAIWIVRLLPQVVVRAVFRWYFEAFHGVDVTGLENLRQAGDRVVVVVNHQSFLDGCFVAAFLPGAPLFAVNIHTAQHWWARLFLSAVTYLPVDPANPFSTRTMVAAVKEGKMLVVFPEGRITTTGAIMKVYDGAGMVADKAGAVLLPIHIDGAQYSPFSRMGGRLPKRLFPRLSMAVLPPVSLQPHPEATGRERRREMGVVLQEVMEEAAFRTARIDRSLFGALLDARDRHGAGSLVLEDTARTPMGYGRLVLGAVVLGRRLAQLAPGREPVGVMLPNATGAVVTFMALQSQARVTAMLNYSAGAEAMLAACAAAEVRFVVSSRAFVEKGKLEAAVARMEGPVRFIWLEDVRAGIGRGDKLRGWWAARRARRLPGARVRPGEAAVVLFTSGSEGVPKGVVLSHRNINANIAQISAVVDFTPADRVFNAMPMFHSFGLTGAALLPLLSGVRTFHYPSPLHYRIVPELIYDTDSTIAFGTDTFLTGWARFAHPYDFYRMRYIFAGAEKVRDETRRLYADKFGARLLEGYGATETSPVLALNTPMHSRPGAAGRLLPGMAHRLKPVEGIALGGRLEVSGPNVMLGYLRADQPGVVDAPEGGWYDTGDVCTVDEDGFVTIQARAKRFAKIAGEMVSMPAAESLAHEVWPGAAHAVVAVPDARKGEALVLLTTAPDATASALLARAREKGTAEIAVPRVVRVVEALPLLATGKVDYPAATRLAEPQAAAA